jgi:hypothetical protein
MPPGSLEAILVANDNLLAAGPKQVACAQPPSLSYRRKFRTSYHPLAV